MSQINAGIKGFKTGAGIAVPLGAYLRVKQVAAADANGFTGTVLLAGPYDDSIGLTEAAVQQAGNHVAVRLRNFPGTRKVVCMSVCAIGARLYPTTNGQCDTQGATGDIGTAGAAIGPAEFVALEACATAGGVVEAMPIASAGISKGGVLFAATSDSAAITNTTTETAFATNQFTLPASSLLVGDVIRLRARAVVTGKNAAETLNIKAYIGGLAGTLIAQSGAVNNAANDEILIDMTVTVTLLGAVGKVQGAGYVTDGIVGTATTKAGSLQSTTLNTTVANLVALSATWSAANAANTVLLRDLVVELVRQ